MLGCLSSFAFDFVVRNKLGGVNLSFYLVDQFPVLHPNAIHNSLRSIATRVIELTYNAWDLETFAKECGYDGPPFRWDEERRIEMRCELDALFFNLYLPGDEAGDWNPCRILEGDVRDETDTELTELKKHFPKPRDAVSYIMDTFPIVKRKDEADHGTYRTKDRVLEIYDGMLAARREGKEWETPLDPPPGPPADDEGNFIPFEQWKHSIPPHIHQPKNYDARGERP